MNIVFYPFFSQQDKRHRKFLLDSDGGVRLFRAMAERAAAAGANVTLVLPDDTQCMDSIVAACSVRTVPYMLAVDNQDRRLQWEPSWLRSISHGADVLVTTHDFLVYPLRCIAPKLRIICEVAKRPDTAWPEMAGMFPLAHGAASLLYCISKELYWDTVKQFGSKACHWPFLYDGSECVPGDRERTVDAIFPARCSATGYTNHELFVSAVQGVDLRCMMTDATSYLRASRSSLLVPHRPLSRAAYIMALQSSNVVVGLTDNGVGGVAFIEAIACGCTPVALRTKAYEDILGRDWPYFCEKDVVSLRSTILRARCNPMAVELKGCSYDEAWEGVWNDLRA